MSWIECDMCMCYSSTCPHCNGRGYVYDAEELNPSLKPKTENTKNKDKDKNKTEQ